MILSKILSEMKIDFFCKDEKKVDSLGLAGYNKGDNVCTFIENEKYIDEITSNVAMILTNNNVAKYLEDKDISFGVCIVDNPRITYFIIHNFLSNSSEYTREKFETKIGENCTISDSAVISPQNVVIGNNVTIEEFVVIRDNTYIGDNSIVRAGCKIGGEGFEFKNTTKEVFRVNHIGGVVIGSNVEVQYNTCIDKAIYPWDDTVIEDYVKIDNLVHIGHAVKIKPRTMIVANSGIGGRVKIGEDSWIGFGATLRNGIEIGNNARTNMGAVVTRSVGDNEAVTGNFAIEHKKFIENLKRY